MGVSLYMGNRLERYFSNLPERGMKLNKLLIAGKTLLDDEIWLLVKDFECELSEVFVNQETILERIGYRTFYYSQSDTWLNADDRTALMEFIADKEKDWIGCAVTGSCDKFDRLFTESVLGRAHNGYFVRHVIVTLARAVVHPESFDYLRAQPSLVKHVKRVEYYRLPCEEIAHRWLQGQTLDPRRLCWR